MAQFTFEAPDLQGAAASPQGRRRLLTWLRDRLAARGIDAIGPVADGPAWRLAVNAEDGWVTIGLDPAGPRRFTVVVDKDGDADPEYEDTVAAFEDALSVSGAVELLACDLA